MIQFIKYGGMCLIEMFNVIHFFISVGYSVYLFQLLKRKNNGGGELVFFYLKNEKKKHHSQKQKNGNCVFHYLGKIENIRFCHN